MNAADWLILAILALSVLVGLWRGFVREALSLVVWVAAIAAAIVFGDQVATLIGDRITLPSARIAIGHIAVFLLVLIVGGLFGWLVGRIVQGTGLSGTDRVLGFAFGLLRGGLIVAALVLVLSYTPMASDPWWRESTLITRFEPAAGWLRDQLPEALQAVRELAPDSTLAPAAPTTAPEPLPAPPAAAPPED